MVSFYCILRALVHFKVLLDVFVVLEVRRCGLFYSTLHILIHAKVLVNVFVVPGSRNVVCFILRYPA